MAKRLSRKEHMNQAVIDLINKMFEIAGHAVTYDDISGRKDAWYTDWTITEAQNKEWTDWGENYLKKKFKMYPKSAQLEMGMIALMWGLKFAKEEPIN